jgi:2-(1,2-epoxy-1,2-dihydrophenyl)acetyl-CoA isomerase
MIASSLKIEGLYEFDHVDHRRRAMSAPPPLLIERRGAVAILTLNRPDVGNAIDSPTAKILMETAITCDEDDSIRCVVLTGTGRYFCVGGDVGSLAVAGDGVGALVDEITAYLHTGIARFANMRKPLVTAINGPAAGAGISLAILGDLALAAKSANFTVAYTAIGLTPDGGLTWLLPRLIGLRRTQELMLTNRRVTSDEAATLGLVTRVVIDNELATEVQATASNLALSATKALGETRRLLLGSFQSAFEAQMERESRTIANAACTQNGREGIRAFIAKRKPDFSQ